MSGKKFWLATIVAFVVYFLAGWLFYGLLLRDWFAAQSLTPEVMPSIAVITLMCLAFAALMAYTYPLGYRGGVASKEGLRFGILFALIAWGPSGLSLHAMGQCNWPALIVSWIWEVIVGAILGVIVAKIYAGSSS